MAQMPRYIFNFLILEVKKLITKFVPHTDGKNKFLDLDTKIKTACFRKKKGYRIMRLIESKRTSLKNFNCDKNAKCFQ